MRYLDFKRVLDLAMVLVIFCLSILVILLIVLCYLVSLEFPLLYSQKRVGRNGTLFTLWKFRTLSQNESLPLEKRTFKLGRFLRRTNLDELPQLWNVLKGEMSLIGPRALPVEYLPLMNEQQRQRHQVLPGITGWAQVNGRSEISWQRKFELDVYYLKHVSLLLDLEIILKTVFLLISFRQDKSLLEEKFKGASSSSE